MVVDTRKREGQQLLLRFPEGSDLRERLEECAKANSRSLTGEIIQRLEASMAWVPDNSAGNADDAPVPQKLFNRLAEKVSWLEARLSAVEKR
ncbi:Arc family DNA-binding protein [Neorhizobium galegae]|jgi:hypothetical protein|uniref:Arc-like DNA binding domain-containing protein n=1 Tax=Neorhizobium galegae bv. officinalis TaxID=323656 RepID=A0A0T7H1L9_NEOGA|nr:Arc family DNA-binding protein [Neorhizobium galegae]CDZ53363.1 Hypothetical protein NGAL_HAMBI1189_49560 [Neorhizobium galegae bv. officinalis]